MNQKWAYRIAILVLVAAAIYLLHHLRSVTIPIMLAAFLAYILDPLIDRLETFRIPRSRSILLLTFLVITLTIGALLLVIPAIENELRVAAGHLPEYLEKFKRNSLPFIERHLAAYFPGADISVDSLVREGEKMVKRIPLDAWQKVLSGVAATFHGTFSLIVSVIGLLIIPLYLFYILKDFDNIKEELIALIPERNRDFFIGKFGEVDEALSSFIRGQLLICLILGVIYSAGLLFIGIDLALVIGILSGAAFIIPYVGTVLGILSASLMAFLQFHDFQHILYVLLLFGGAQILEGTLITPKIIGDKMGLHPLIIILAIIIGGELFGLMGMLLAVPAAATIRIFLKSALKSYKESAYFLGTG